MGKHPTYNTVLPPNVRYDKRLKHLAIILYSEIKALASKEGYCNAANSYFAALYSVSAETISRNISLLVDNGHVRHEIDQTAGNERRLYPIDENVKTPIDENVKTPIDENVKTPIDENVKTPIDENVKTPIDENVKLNNISLSKDKDYIVELIKYLNEKAGRSFSDKTAATRKHLRARLAEGYTPEQIKAVIDDRVMRWGADTHMAEYLRPNTLFAGKFESYLQAAQSSPRHANSDDALNDCDLSEEDEAAYQRYIQYALNNYLNLFKSPCRIFSKSEYIDYLTNSTMPGITYLLTPREKKDLQLRLHAKLNAEKWFRDKYPSVWEAYRAAVKAIANHEKPLV